MNIEAIVNAIKKLISVFERYVGIITGGEGGYMIFTDTESHDLTNCNCIVIREDTVIASLKEDGVQVIVDDNSNTDVPFNFFNITLTTQDGAIRARKGKFWTEVTLASGKIGAYKA